MNKKKKIIIITCMVLAVIALGVVLYLCIDIKKIDGNMCENEIIPQEEISDKQLRETTIKLYFVDNNNEMAEEIRKIDSKILLNEPYKEILKLLISGEKTENFKSLIPKNVLINNVNKIGDCLNIDFSKEFIDNAPEDTTAQSLIISQIVNTMTQFTEINSIKIIIDGQENQSFKNGNINFEQIFTNED